MRIRLLIVGFDPGTKAGLALIDTFGRIVFLTSKTNTSISSFSQMILKHGKAIIVASDRKPLPKSVEKLAKSLGAKLFYPPESLSVHEKIELVKRYDIRTKNDHERDAVAAALKAYKHYVGLFKKINTSLNSLGLTNIYNTVVESMIFGYADNLDEAINKALSGKIVTLEEKKPITIIKTERKVDVKRLEKDIEILKKYNEKLLEENRKLKEMIKVKTKIVAPRKNDKNLKEIIELLKKTRRLEIEGKIPLIELKDLSLENLENLNEKIDLFGRVVLVDSENLVTLNNFGVKAAVSLRDVDKSKIEFPVIVLDKKDIHEKEGIKYIEAFLFDERIKEARKTGLIEWVKNYRNRKI
ncbi:MAG: DUF460 domain-containing protein [Candidatus Aenigmarchaeota archaeon]|nr:DUF460 domain-containing protein [Candidatus Aenigmarchaeota archaeon]